MYGYSLIHNRLRPKILRAKCWHQLTITRVQFEFVSVVHSQVDVFFELAMQPRFTSLTGCVDHAQLVTADGMPNVLLHYRKHQRPRTQLLALQHPPLLTLAQKATQPITQPQTAPVTSQTQVFARLEATTLTILVALHVPRRCLAYWGRSALFRPACPMHCLCFRVCRKSVQTITNRD